MKVYQVGGAVRDRLLGLAIKDRDWMVVGATETQMLNLGFRQVEGDFPIFLHPETGDEYALARTEVKVGNGYKGFTFKTGPDISLEQDLQRRDLTINAMVQDERGNIIDPCHGQIDLDARRLRHITPAFSEDPLRLLRVARFAARLSHLGFHLAHDTFKLMKQMAQTNELASLSRARIWMEIKGALEAPQPWRFFEITHRCGALRQLLPPLDHGMHAHHGHGEPPTDAMDGLKRAVVEQLSLEGRFAVLVLSLIPHDSVAEIVDVLPLEKAFRDLLSDLATEQEYCEAAVKRDVSATLKLIHSCRALQQPQRLLNLIRAFQVLTGVSSPQAEIWIHQAIGCMKNVSVETIKELGLKGAEIGVALEEKRKEALKILAVNLVDQETIISKD